MPNGLIPYSQPRGTIHSVTSLLGLGADRCNILFVSDRTLYLLHNFAALDVTFLARYATEETEYGFRSLTEDHATYAEVLEAIELFQYEVQDMSCDIEGGLRAIADSLSEIALATRGAGGGGCASVGSPVFNCIVNLDNSELLPGDDLEQGDPEIDDPPEGFETWSEYFEYKCQAAGFIWLFIRQFMVAMRNLDAVWLTAQVVAPIVAGLAGLLPVAFTPAGFIAFVGGIIALGVLTGFSWFYIGEMLDFWDENKEDIICALYSSGSSPEAVTALSSLIEDAIQAIVTWGALEPIADKIAEALGGLFGFLVGNGLVEPLFKVVASVTDVALELDCSECEEDPSVIAKTNEVSPYDTIIKGIQWFGLIIDPTGIKGNSGSTHVALSFNTVASVTNFSATAEMYFAGSTTNAIVTLYYWDGDSWESAGPSRQDTLEPGAWNLVEFSGENPLPAETLCLIDFTVSATSADYFVRNVEVRDADL